MNIILKPFVWVLLFLNDLFGNYGLALILFAVVIKVLLFPFALKGKRSMVQMNALQGKLQRLQKQYANNREKYNEEMQKLYEKENVKPMSGCLWTMLPLLLLIPLYAIIRQPMQYMMGATIDQVTQVANSVLGWTTSIFSPSGAAFTAGAYNELFAASLMNAENLSEVVKVIPDAFVINFDFLGMNLAQVPQLKVWEQALTWNNIGLFTLPLVSAVLSFAFSRVTVLTNRINQAADAPQKSNMGMTLFSVVMSLWIGYYMPGGLCLYWIANNVLSMVQELVCAKLLKKDYAAARERQRQQELLEKEEEKRRKAALAAERAKRIEERKKAGKKKAKASDAPAGPNNSASRVGIRANARGRAYDPDRYGGVTPYRDPDVVDEAAIESALEKKAEAREEAQLEAEITAKVAAEVERDFQEGKLTDAPAEDAPAEDAPAQEETPAVPAPENVPEEPEETPEEPEDVPEEPEETHEEPEKAPVTPAPKYDAPDHAKKDQAEE